EITVSELTKTAGINRKTFYYHYNNIRDVLDDIENAILRVFEEDLAKLDFQEALRNPELLYNAILSIYERNTKELRLLILAGNTLFFKKVTQSVKQMATAFFLSKHPKDPLRTKLLVDYCISGIVAIFEEALTHGYALDAQTIIRTISLLTVGAIQHYEEQE
ncbi:MAG: TetR/AcrR family transcriptional regulator, partial [Christensenellaceae bacterium]